MTRIDVDSGAQLVLAEKDYIWASTETGVVRIDPDTNAVVRVIEGLTAPYGFNLGFGSAWISKADDTPRGWIERYDLATGELIARIDVGLMPLESITAFDSIWVPNHHSSSVSRIDPTTNTVVATIEVQNGFGDPYGLAAGDELVWSSSPNGGFISGIDPETNSVTTEHATSACWIAASFGRVWAPSCNGSSMRVFDQEDASVSSTLRNPPAGIPVADGERVWAAAVSTETGHLTFTSMDMERLEFGAAVDTQVTEPWSWTFAFGTLWVATGNEIVRFAL